MADDAKQHAFMDKMLADLGGALSVSLVRIGDRLGLYAALYERGPMTARELADKAGIAERYAREWLAQQAASGYLAYHGESRTFELPEEQANVFALPDSPYFMQGAFDLAAAMIENQAPVEAAFKTGGGVGWGEQAQCLFCATGRFFRPAYNANLLSSWLPSLDGVVDKLGHPSAGTGARVADVGCGHGYSTIMMAKAFPQARFVGYDFHPDSVAQARVHAQQHGVAANTSFEVALASDFPAKDLDLVTFFDCLHDMGDPVGAARHVRESLKPDGTWMVVEPQAGDRLEDNLNPIGRLSYAGSTMVCVPTSLAQPVGLALGAQAGFKRLAAVIGDGGFGHVRKAAETAFNMVIEARA